MNFVCVYMYIYVYTHVIEKTLAIWLPTLWRKTWSLSDEFRVCMYICTDIHIYTCDIEDVGNTACNSVQEEKLPF